MRLEQSGRTLRGDVVVGRPSMLGMIDQGDDFLI
jgi:hypothetical protein